MSTVLKAVISERELNTTSSNILKTTFFFNKSKSENGIKCKENYFKHKCNKALKNKLKKYKLRRDGKEDPEVVNVSHTFQCSLNIKSPNNNYINELNIFDTEVRPRNYLFNMVRKKRDIEKAMSVKSLFKELPRDSTTDNQVTCDKTDNEEILHINCQDKKHKNAFKLMMDSRNKSLGGNSPGKEKTVDDDDFQSIKEAKNHKAKRLLVLQKMAEAKGSVKKKEQEEFLEEAIKKKMDKRAERLTSMLINSSSKQVKAKTEPLLNKKKQAKLPTHSKTANEKVVLNKKCYDTLNLISIFEGSDEIEANVNGLGKKHIPKEDLEFIQKLSPSIRKKENMLCYFNKVGKDDESLSPSQTEDAEHNSPIIKVKFDLKKKKKLKKNKLTQKLESSCELKDENISPKTKIQVEDLNSKKIATKGKSGTRKRKREQIAEEKVVHIFENIENPLVSVEVNERKNERPKRNVRKSIQYQDDLVLSSSDEEYNIFTPKKKKHIDKKLSPKFNKDPKPATSNTIKLTKNYVKVTKKPANNNNKKNNQTNVKLAPIFAPKRQLDAEALEAKQKFLQSGVPEKLKMISSQQKQTDTEMYGFPTVVHIQQTVNPENNLSSSLFNYSLKCESEADSSPVKDTETVFQDLLSPEKLAKNKQLIKVDNNVRKLLQKIKLSYPKFPVYRTYHLLKAKSKGEFGDSYFPELDNSLEMISYIGDINKAQVDKFNWTDKYKPRATNQIIGNFETTRELKKWLESWSANDAKKTNDRADSDSSDFCYSDPDSRDSIKTTDNLLILTGPTGCGKTSCVYAVAAELAIKVIEVNASSKRNGKIMIQDLQEATQSHKVNRGKGSTSAENSQKSQEIIDVDLRIKIKKRGRPRKPKDVAMAKPKNEVLSPSTKSQENIRTGMSLILIDDADIVFDQDEGFCSAISQLIQCSKRPVILVTTSLVCPHLQRFLQSGKIMNMKPLLPRMLGTWLDIMCLADSSTCWPGLGSVLLDLFKGDIRKTINCLQFYTSTQMHQGSKQIEEYSPNGFYDENSSTSWAGSENQDERYLDCTKTSLQETDRVWKYFMEKEMHLLHINFPSDLYDVWCNVPRFLNITKNRKASEDSDDKLQEVCELNEIAGILDEISVADYFGHLRPDARTNICSQPWYSSECDSSSEYENFSCYNKTLGIIDDISKTLIVRSICYAKKSLQCNNDLYVKPTKMAVKRERDRVVSRHDNISVHLNATALLDRRGLALDYWSSCREICRFEKAKTNTNSKRNNRFCHYLRSLKIMCKNDVFDKLCESLNAEEGNFKLDFLD